MFLIQNKPSNMKSMRNLFKYVMIVAAGAIVFYACSKDKSESSTVPSGKQQLSLYLTDGPTDFFDKVNIDIKSVKVLVDTCDKSRRRREDDSVQCKVWDSLSIKPGVYDLLSLRNGIDTLLAGGVVTDGSIRRIVITLGTNNSIVKDSVNYPLNLLNGQTITIKLYGNEWENFSTGHYRLWLDFDCGRSIVQLRNGQFSLVPFIRAFIVKESGAVKGVIKPGNSRSIITVFNATDTAYALPFGDGEWKVRGLNTGTYSVYVNAGNGYQDTTINNVSVTVGKETNVGTITLHK
ncbi:hypothetical protein A4D02_33425 [Niastella koreensis]|uniref:DUF4382 domain-containing protein n=3 Tax=Niastella koreensis TaxID=354356 RepID=G8TFE4_NIAKG|nr:hypothetical protein Niako_0975 [Niastella koreensis GR20-10]OQP45558.1 hypothetical protein A4D02_33425 [Niastella koreensis]